MPTSKIAETLARQKTTILEDWIRAQLAATTLRSDLMDVAKLRTESTHFLDLLSAAAGREPSLDPRSSAFEAVRQMLGELSASRSQLGFSPAETATFVFSFKQPLFHALREHCSGEELFAEVWAATVLLDQLGMHTVETFQASRESVIRRQQEDMMELSTPVVRLWEGVVAVPLIGTLDSNRTNMVMEALLTEIVNTGSEIAIIDITGVPTVDTLVAQHLLKTVAATRLMGAECIISGIRPQIAQTMVHLQIDLSTVTTKSTLAEALVVALRRTGFTVARQAEKLVR
jgi:rsbT co-antagonist protein RsbR